MFRLWVRMQEDNRTVEWKTNGRTNTNNKVILYGKKI